MNIQEIVLSVKDADVQSAQEQVIQMETEDLTVLGPMNMLAFEN